MSSLSTTTARAWVAGFGFRAGATTASLQAALDAALALVDGAVPSPHPDDEVRLAITLFATVQDKAGAPCLQALAARLGMPVRAVTPSELLAVPTLTASQAVQARRGTGSVAEAAALAAAGPGAALPHPRSVSPDRLATCALATTAPLPFASPWKTP